METTPNRRIDLFAALSLATDLALGQASGFALKSCVLGARLAKAVGADASQVGMVVTQALLRYVGCNADTHLMAALLGDEYAVRRDFARIDLGRANEVLGVVVRALRRHNAGASPAAMALAIVQGLAQSPATSRQVLTGHCEVAERIADRLGLGDEMRRCLGQLYERWDGRGIPKGLRGDDVAFPVRVVTLAQDAIVLAEAFGLDTATDMIARRSGGAYDPQLASLFTREHATLMANLDRPVDIEAVRALEPERPVFLDEAGIDAACLVIADIADMRMPHTIGHSRAVARLAEAAARRMGLPAADVRKARRAGLVHDIGEVVVPVAVWTRRGALDEAERDQVRLHTYHSERILKRAGGCFEGIALVAGRHHERLDGSGYHRGCRAADLSPVARILAAAEAYQGWIETRPHRTAQQPSAAAARLNAAMREGALCSDAGAAVLEAAGQRPAVTRGPLADLTAREVEVLRLLAAGQTAKDVARTLAIAPKTAGNHIQNLYGKLGVTTRAAAVLFAVEHGLVGS